MASEEENEKSILSKEEQEKWVIKYLKEGKTYRKITDLTGATSPQIRKIKKKLEGIVEQPPISIRAFKLFKEGMQPDDVAIGLQIGSEETLKYYREFQHLKAEEVLLQVRDKLGKDLLPFVDLFREMSCVFSLEHIKEALRIADNMDKAYSNLALLEMDMERTQKAVEKLNREYSEMKEMVSVTKEELEFLNSSKQFLIDGIKALSE